MKEAKEARAKLFSRTPLNFSIIFNLVWKFFDQRLQYRVIDNNLAIQKYRIKEKAIDSYLARGPDFQYDTDGDIYRYLAMIRGKLFSTNVPELPGQRD
jgi:hypothetical protein